ncbi:2-oxoglutarate dehydrogenase complex dihydrolipoyllysine-residue succinyltransferase [Rickettsia conorii]|uniref:Dihydrolipoyllysine-residue succinyltransferase component of 2-oxoglutarate dehydrogenase complex n=1 Tax=Rickettsia conorii (strain ATCC VR-613 / Malish 7) TaxID=272944 RepID=ODO2_RICCN|nr:2-oxoglutarate dehydrogenase complex dihydrolipoyllysine-residue succinyltransferase [Rickettsia conorii]Q92J43.1 RecName: Full=Dihydrolipoyllysine-residue succinyltransferase component of 2-oxoglutarate dehydrogenase complex; AltName: Full=2-oxoglutarate dehydrogenase complex component E2; Short=OGDC-E2; AltName: Full=Dihydrolipoamide succinyltransferase component of 2-oxoglutarate dehydrogenase complex [Rickettsia conorii str. Malish 7]AAL02764.1 dihydrolipoamide acetyltransferase component 
MRVKIIVPSLGESITEATIAKWYKKQGDSVKTDELLLEIETEKVTLEVNAPCNGTIGKISKTEGANVAVGEEIGEINEGASANTAGTNNESAKAQAVTQPTSEKPAVANNTLAPSVQKLVTENKLDPNNIKGTGRDGRITKGDVLATINTTTTSAPAISKSNEERVQRVRMSRLRKTIAQRLKDSQNTAAILTTFNEIDMSKVIALRNQYKEEFEKKHAVKLGFMSFFVKATIEALKLIPSVNAEIDGDDLVYKNYYDIGVAVGTEQGLVVPVVRDADKMGFAEVEKTIGILAKQAREGKLSMADLSGGTFSISNGGVYGSLLSTPIINPPQSGILGLHKTEERAVVIDGKIEIRPMMYIALSYDHRIIDGKEGVSFLVKIKQLIENPEKLLLNL